MDRSQIDAVDQFALHAQLLKTHNLELDAVRQLAVDCTRSAGFELAGSTAAEETWSTLVKCARPYQSGTVE